MAQNKMTGHLRPAQVEITVLQPEPFRRIDPILDKKRRRGRGVQQAPLRDDHFYRARGQIGIFHALRPQPDESVDRQNILGAQHVRPRVGLLGDLGTEDDLGQARAIAQIDKDEATVVAAKLHPAHEADAGVNVAGA